MIYEKTYGPQYRPSTPDFSRCAKAVYSSSSWHSSQCSRKAVCDPDEKGNPTTCKQHSEAKTNERRAKQKAAYDADMARFKIRSAGPRMRDALQKIADGHNDPRALAVEILETLK